MSAKTTIEWTESTWTPIRARRVELQADGSGKERIGWHCEHASPGCINCYAEGINKRLGTGREFKPAHLIHKTAAGDNRGDVSMFLDEKMLLQPLRWKKPRMIFVCSMTDLFADFVETDWIRKIFAVMALTPQHTYQVLTKRARRMRYFLSAEGARGRIIGCAWEMLGHLPKYKHQDLLNRPWPLPNVWPGVSVEDQDRAQGRVPDLLHTPGVVHWVSVEPQIGPVDFRVVEMPDGDELGTGLCNLGGAGSGIDWIVQGGESGPKARPMHPEWARSMRDQAADAHVAYLLKQWGSWAPWNVTKDMPLHAPRHIHIGDEETLTFVGKKAAGRLLDGVQHDGFPA